MLHFRNWNIAPDAGSLAGGRDPHQPSHRAARLQHRRLWERSQDMNANVCVPVRRRCVGIAVMAFVISAGCTPRPMPWLESAITIQPGVTQPEKPQPPHGFLSIETNPLYLPGF